jgi:predicted nuclease of predicted toxin-antitoxin system
LNFLIDAQLPPALAKWISARGHKAVHVFDLGLHTATDRVVWEHARTTNAVVVSKDEDFVARWLLSETRIALVWVRRGNCSNQALMGWFEPLWPETLRRLEQGEQLIELRG